MASVDGRDITRGQIRREVDRVLRGRQANDEAVGALEKKALQQLVSRQLILGYLQRHKQGASQQDVDLKLSRVEKRLAAEGKTLQEFLETSSLTREQLRAALAWQVGWQRFLDRYLSDDNLEKYFREHRREFDGTKLHVAHVLWKADSQDAEAVEAARSQAAAIRQKLVDGELDFAAAARKHSQSPTAEKGGEIGVISRHEPMPESFSKAAFALDQGGVSPPVATPFGVHLILCRRIDPGQRRWQDVRGRLELAVTEYLFNWVADQERPRAKIVYARQVVPARKGDPAGKGEPSFDPQPQARNKR